VSASATGTGAAVATAPPHRPGRLSGPADRAPLTEPAKLLVVR